MAAHGQDYLACILSYLDNSGLKNGLALLGLLWTAKVSLTLAFNIVKGMRIYLLAQVTRKNNFRTKYGGRWAVVTGASEGIGRSFACELAQCGMNVVLMSRSTQKLEKVAETIVKECKVETHIIPIDFATQDVYQKITTSLEGLDIGILVNNVGVMYDYPQYFLDVPKQKLFDLININMTSLIMVLRNTNEEAGNFPFFGTMCDNDFISWKRGAIINMSSSAGELPTPQMTVYAATKEFVDSFSRALAFEYAPQGIEVQSLRPFYVATAMTYGTKANIVVPSPETYVKSALYTLGLSRRNTGYWSHGIQGWFVSFCPEWLWMCTATLLNNQIRRVVLRNRKQ